MTDKKEDPPLPEFLEEAHALLHEKHIPDRQGLINNQDVGIDMDDHRKREADIHPTRIGFDRLLHEITDIGEGRNLVKALIDHLLGNPQNRCIHVDILPP